MTTIHLHQLGALSATGLALLLALLDRTPNAAGDPNAAGTAWADAVEAGADHITTRALADRLLGAAGGPSSDFVLVDVRPQSEFDAFHLPGATRLSLPELLGAAGDDLRALHPGKTLILYSNGPAHPGQAWVELRRRGVADVLVLDGGLEAFVADELTPPSLRRVPGQSQELAERFAALRAVVLGTAPQGAAPAEPAPQDKPAAAPSPAIGRFATDPSELSQPTMVSTAWLAKNLGAVVVVDTREKAEDFAGGHVPGAVHAPIGLLRETRDGVGEELLAANDLAVKIGALGIDADAAVVAYGGDRLQDPAHFVLALLRLGHRRVAILEGGLPAWRHEGRELSQETKRPSAKTYAPAAGADSFTVRLADVKKASETKRPAILDVRPADAFAGEESREARGGHVPGSINREYTADVVTGERGVFFKPLAELRQAYAALGLAPDEPVIVSCRTGHQAAQTWFALRYLLGHADVRWYDGSWKEWAAHPELPAATGRGDQPR
jgi:thiosulfate/3-mercaptopyruvate sulfurtransferase